MELVMQKQLLNIEHLSIGFGARKQIHHVVDDISFSLDKGEILGIVGESGSGKSMTALAIMGLLAKDAKICGGCIEHENLDLLKQKPDVIRKMKGTEMAMIFQEPMTSLNPLQTIGAQIDEMLFLHEKTLNQEERKNKTLKALLEAGLIENTEVYEKYPHQLSGGMRQRAMIAMAMICKPKLLIADEPTTALDVTIQAQILKLIQRLSIDSNTAVILISHDLGVIKNICKRVLVMENGKIVERGSTEQIFHNPQNAYTKKLLAAVPYFIEKESAEYHNSSNKKVDGKDKKILEINNLNSFYEGRKKGLFGEKSKVQILKNVSFFMSEGESFGIVGESGSGKSTLAKAILGLVKDINGDIFLNDNRPQMVFQDPYGSLNPVKKVGWILEEPLKLKGIRNGSERKGRVEEILCKVGLGKEYSNRYLYQLSSGQRQRVAIGVALIQESNFIILDEPVSALDVTVQAQILTLLKDLQKEFTLSYLFISHDLKVVSQMCDRVLVMYQGEIVELEKAERIFKQPEHEYTKKLVEAVL